MPINFRCTSCSARLYAPSRTAGTSIECPKCSTRVVVPGRSASADPGRFEERNVERRIGAIGSAAEELGRLMDTVGGQQSSGIRRTGDREANWPFLNRYPFVPGWLVWCQGLFIALALIVGFAAGAWWVRGR